MGKREKKAPELETLGDVVRWVVAELGVLCPSPERLAAYFANPDDASLRDVRYHVEETHCPICRAEREMMQGETPG